MVKFRINALDGKKIVHKFSAFSIIELFEICETIEAAGLNFEYMEV